MTGRSILLMYSNQNHEILPRPEFLGKRRRSSGGLHQKRIKISRRLFFDDRSDDIDIQQVVLKKKQHSEAINTALEIIRSSVEESDNNVDLSDLGLKFVPKELEELKNLVVMYPSLELTSDLKLYLNNNKLSNFPKSILALHNLTTLIISNNKLKELPPEISFLRNLQQLSIIGNGIEYLPSEILWLDKLRLFFLFPNPLLQHNIGANHEFCKFVPPNDTSRAFIDDPPMALKKDAKIPSLFDLASRVLFSSNSAYDRPLPKTSAARTFNDLHQVFDPQNSSGCDLFEYYRHVFIEKSCCNVCAHCMGLFLFPSVTLLVWLKGDRWSLNFKIPFSFRYCTIRCFQNSRFFTSDFSTRNMLVN